MFADMPALNSACHYFMIFVFGAFAVMFILCLIRMIIGPNVADRLLASNMIGGPVICTIAVLGILLDETYLLDVGLIYTLISFLAVVIISQIYIGVYREKNQKQELREKKLAEQAAGQAAKESAVVKKSEKREEN